MFLLSFFFIFDSLLNQVDHCREHFSGNDHFLMFDSEEWLNDNNG